MTKTEGNFHDLFMEKYSDMLKELYNRFTINQLWTSIDVWALFTALNVFGVYATISWQKCAYTTLSTESRDVLPITFNPANGRQNLRAIERFWKLEVVREFYENYMTDMEVPEFNIEYFKRTQNDAVPWVTYVQNWIGNHDDYDELKFIVVLYYKSLTEPWLYFELFKKSNFTCGVTAKRISEMIENSSVAKDYIDGKEAIMRTRMIELMNYTIQFLLLCPDYIVLCKTAGYVVPVNEGTNTMMSAAQKTGYEPQVKVKEPEEPVAEVWYYDAAIDWLLQRGFEEEQARGIARQQLINHGSSTLAYRIIKDDY